MSTGVLQAAARLHDGGRLLVARPRFLGDVVLSLSLVQVLRRAFPRAELHYLAEREPLEVLRGHPDLDRLWRLERGAGAALRLVWQLRTLRFAAVIDLFSGPRTAVIARATGAPVRIGLARRLRRHLYTVARRPEPGQSVLQQHLDAARCLGVAEPAALRPRLHLGADELRRGADLLAARVSGVPRILLHLAASQPAKEWPEENAVELAERLRARGARLLLSRAPMRPEPGERVAGAVPGAVLLPALPLREFLALLAAVDAVVAVDGGIAHASVALGRPTLALFGPTDPRLWFPYQAFGPYRVLHAGTDCRGCDRVLCPLRTCMRALDVDAVERGVLELLPSRHDEPRVMAS